MNQNVNQNLIHSRDAERIMADVVSDEVTSVQVIKYEDSLLRLMRRTNKNVDLVNALNNFINALAHNSYFGDFAEQITEGNIVKITEAINEASDKLRWACGAQPAEGLKSDWRK